MRLPFFGPRADAPIRIPLPELLQVGFGIYFCTGGRPAPEPDDLTAMIGARLESHAADPLRTAIQGCLDQGLLRLDVQEKCFMPAPPLEFLRYMAPGEAEIQRFQQASHLVLLALPDQVGSPCVGLWGAVAAARAVAGVLEGVIFDPEIPRLLPIASHAEPLPADGRIKITDHIVVPFSVDRRGLGWMTTKGMGKFGLPELEIRDVPPDLQQTLGMVVNGFARSLLARVARLAESGSAPPRELQLPSEIRVSLQDLAGDEADSSAEPPEGVLGWTMLRLQYRPGRRGASTFLALLPPRGFRGDPGVWLNGLLTDLFGAGDTLRFVKPDSEAMEAAHLQALAELPAVKERFQAGLPPGGTLYVKQGFPTGDDGCEYIWIVVNTWTGDCLRGQLANDPQLRTDLRAGQTVELRESDIFDWILNLPGGSREGGYTIAVVEQEGRKDEA